MSVAGLERMTTGSAVSALSYRATQVDIYKACLKMERKEIVNCLQFECIVCTIVDHHKVYLHSL